jgi:hypothetical protein
LYNIREIVTHGYQQCSFLSVCRANLVDPAEDERASAILETDVNRVSIVLGE